MTNSKLPKGFKKGTLYTHFDLKKSIKKNNPNLNNNSIQWVIFNMLKGGQLKRNGYNEYQVNDNKTKLDYKPNYSKKAKKIIKLIDLKYKDIKYSIFEFSFLNEFLNHQINSNIILIDVEKEMSNYVFRYLQELNYTKILLRPSVKDIELYWDSELIIINNLISESPINNGCTLEKILVDIYSDKILINSYNFSEYKNILKQAFDKYNINKAKLLRYARRRNKENEIKKIIQEVSNVI